LDRFSEHDKFQEDMMRIIRPCLSNGHVPDTRLYINGTLFSIDFKTTRNVENNSRDVYFALVEDGEKVAIVYNSRPFEKAESGKILAGWIEDLNWEGPIPPSERSRSGDPYYKISGGVPLLDFIKSI
jgi:hypothetical protein